MCNNCLFIITILGIFYLDSGLTVDKIGLSNVVGNIVGLFLFPVWGAVMDSIKRNRMIFITIMMLALAVAEFSKPWVVMFVSHHKFVPICETNRTANHTTNHTHCVTNKVWWCTSFLSASFFAVEDLNRTVTSQFVSSHYGICFTM